MLKRFYITLMLAFVGFASVGLLSPGIGEVLLGTLVCGLCLVAALVFYVVRPNPTGTITESTL